MLIPAPKNHMENKYIKKTSIPGLLILERPVFEDERGFFKEIFHMDELEKEIGFEFKPVQMNHSRSLPSVLRGLHAEQWNKM
ncbi:MAG: RmlC, partial [Candidatus Daviesbacteria bacterium GW2011_GWF2_38_6]